MRRLRGWGGEGDPDATEVCCGAQFGGGWLAAVVGSAIGCALFGGGSSVGMCFMPKVLFEVVGVCAAVVGMGAHLVSKQAHRRHLAGLALRRTVLWTSAASLLQNGSLYASILYMDKETQKMVAGPFLELPVACVRALLGFYFAVVWNVLLVLPGPHHGPHHSHANIPNASSSGHPLCLSLSVCPQLTLHVHRSSSGPHAAAGGGGLAGAGAGGLELETSMDPAKAAFQALGLPYNYVMHIIVTGFFNAWVAVAMWNMTLDARLDGTKAAFGISCCCTDPELADPSRAESGGQAPPDEQVGGVKTV